MVPAGRVLVLGGLATAIAAAEPGAPLRWMEELRAANQDRGALAGESAAWSSEQDRLRAAIAVAAAERDRLAALAKEAEAAAAGDRSRAAAMTGGQAKAVQERLAAGVARIRAALAVAAGACAPGMVRPPGPEAALDPVVAALHDAERAAAAVETGVVAGRLGDAMVAVRTLRVGGAAAWWAAIDGEAAGTVQRRDGVVTFVPADDADAARIREAIAMVDGLRAPALCDLPLMPWPEQAR